MENPLDKSAGRFVGIQGEPVIHFLFEIAEQSQVEALKDMAGVRGKSNDFHPMICQHLERLGMHMDGTIVHEEDSFFVSEFITCSQLINVRKQNR
jgi:hypothetical protein